MIFARRRRPSCRKRRRSHAVKTFLHGESANAGLKGYRDVSDERTTIANFKVQIYDGSASDRWRNGKCKRATDRRIAWCDRAVRLRRTWIHDLIRRHQRRRDICRGKYSRISKRDVECNGLARLGGLIDRTALVRE